MDDKRQRPFDEYSPSLNGDGTGLDRAGEQPTTRGRTRESEEAVKEMLSAASVSIPIGRRRPQATPPTRVTRDDQTSAFLRGLFVGTSLALFMWWLR